MYSRPHYTDWTYMGATGSCGPYSPFSIPNSVWVIEAYVQIFKSVALSCLPQMDGRTDGARSGLSGDHTHFEKSTVLLQNISLSKLLKFQLYYG